MHQESNRVLNRKGQQRRARDEVERRLAVGDYKELADILMDLQLAGRAPARSTFYGWVKEWKEARGKDDSGWWTLATDVTARPDLVMRVLGALEGTREWFEHPDARITHADAKWIVRLATALPGWLEREQSLIDPPELDLLVAAMRYNALQASGDTEAMERMDRLLASLYTEVGSRLLMAKHDAIQRQVKSRED